MDEKKCVHAIVRCSVESETTAPSSDSRAVRVIKNSVTQAAGRTCQRLFKHRCGVYTRCGERRSKRQLQPLLRWSAAAVSFIVIMGCSHTGSQWQLPPNHVFWRNLEKCERATDKGRGMTRTTRSSATAEKRAMRIKRQFKVTQGHPLSWQSTRLPISTQ